MGKGNFANNNTTVGGICDSSRRKLTAQKVDGNLQFAIAAKVDAMI